LLFTLEGKKFTWGGERTLIRGGEHEEKRACGAKGGPPRVIR